MSSVGMLVWRSAGCWTRESTGMMDREVSWEAGHGRKLGSQRNGKKTLWCLLLFYHLEIIYSNMNLGVLCCLKILK